MPRSVIDLDQNEEYCEVVLDGEPRRIRFHDYAQIYQIPGLYEQLFADLLQCDSPRVLVEMLGRAMAAAGASPRELRVLDFGAGNGMVAEQLRQLGAQAVVGVDLLPEARDAALRDRPGVYRDYLAVDMTALGDDARGALEAAGLNSLTCVAALGFDDVPPAAFATAFNIVADGGWIAFNLRDRYMDSPSAFSTMLDRMFTEGVLDEVSRTRYRHRLSVSGEPLEYIALIARKRRDIPDAWLG